MVVVAAAAAAVARERCAERCGSKFPPFFRFRPANRGKAARSRTETRNQYGMQMVGRKRGYRLGKQPGSRGGEAGEFGRNFNCEHADFSIGEKLVCR